MIIKYCPKCGRYLANYLESHSRMEGDEYVIQEAHTCKHCGLNWRVDTHYVNQELVKAVFETMTDDEILGMVEMLECEIGGTDET